MVKSKKKTTPGPLVQELIDRYNEPQKVFEKLMSLEIIAEKPAFPKLIVVGAPKAGKLIVVGKLIKLALPDDYDMQVPFIVNFQKHAEQSSRKFSLCFRRGDSPEEVYEHNLVSKIKEGQGMPMPNVIELTISQKDVFDFTIIVLPGADDYSNDAQIGCLEGYVKKHAPDTDTNCLYLHGISAPTYKSSTTFKSLNKFFNLPTERTVIVFSNIESCSESVVTKLTSKKVESQFGYLFVGKHDDSIVMGEKGRIEGMFDPFSKLDTKFVGYKVISKKIVTGLWKIVFGHQSLLYEKVLVDIQKTARENKHFETQFSTLQEALPTILHCAISASSSLQKLFILKDYQEYKDVEALHAAEMICIKFKEFHSKLLNPSIHTSGGFLSDECMMLKDANAKKDVADPPIPASILPRLMHGLLSRGSDITHAFIRDVFRDIDSLVTRVLLDHAESHKQLHSTLKSMAKMVTYQMRTNFKEKVDELFELERNDMHTCQPSYSAKLEELREIYEPVKIEISQLNSEEQFKKSTLAIKGLGEVNIIHLKFEEVKILKKALDLKMQLICYWPFVVDRLVDYLLLELMSFLKDTVPFGIRLAMDTFLKESVWDNKLLDAETWVAESTSNLDRRTRELVEVKKSIHKLQMDLLA